MTGATLDGMISSRNSSRLARAARARRTTVASWSAFIAGVVVGVVEAEHLDHVLERPFGERAAVVGLDLGSSRSGRLPGSSTGRPIQSPVPAAA